MFISDIAKVCHEANRGYCEALGDTSQVPWKDAPEWQRTSAMNGVAAIIERPDTTPEQSHEGWMAEKLAAGWKYGPVKNADPAVLEHPCIVPYAELSPEQRAKDHIFRAIVLAMIVP